MDLRSLSWVLCVMSAGLGACVADYEPMDGAEYSAPAASNEISEYDPFAGDLPALILEAQLQQSKGKLLGIPIQRELYDYGQANTTDPCPWLLLARDSMARNWEGFAMRQYGLALRADERVARTLNVLADVLLVSINFTGVEESDANALLLEYWGLAAIPAIDRALAEMEAAGRAQAASKLMHMRETLIASAQQ